MSRDQLTEAVEALRDGAEAVADETARQRLRDQADQFAAIADGERDADHGKLARHEHILSELAEEHPVVEAQVDAALESIRSYRATLEGV